MTGHKKASVKGYTPTEQGDISNVWDFTIESQNYVEKKRAQKKNQLIELPNEPVGIAWFSDLHLGSGYTNYRQILADAKLVNETEGLYAEFHGDATDNWIVGKLQALQRGQAVSKKLEDKMFVDWVKLVREKLIVWCSGNHDEWTTKLTGWSPAEELLRDTPVLFDPFQISFVLRHGGIDRTVLVRHKWRYGSIYNPTHPIEVGWDRGDIDFDIGVAGHTHIGTYCRPFHRHNKRRYAILTGTYKGYDAFGEEIGFPDPKDSGCGMMVLMPGQQDLMWFDSLKQGALFLNWARLVYKENAAKQNRISAKGNKARPAKTSARVRATSGGNKGKSTGAKGANKSKPGKGASAVKRGSATTKRNGRNATARPSKRK